MELSGLESMQNRLREILKASPALAFARSAQTLWSKAWKHGRRLNESEAQQLREQGNTCTDWAGLRLLGLGSLSSIVQCRFEGQVLLDSEAGSSTLIRSRIRNSKIGASKVEDSGLLDGVWVEDGASIRRVGTISSGFQFGLGLAIHPGSETGLRRVFLMDGWLLQDCTDMANLPPAAQDVLAKELQSYLKDVDAKFTWIGSGANVESTPVIEDCFVGQNSMIRGATALRRCVLSSTEEAPIHIGDGAIAENSVLETGTAIRSHGQVRRSMLLEHSSVERAGQVAESVLGPNTHIAKGEVTASLVGPFVGFHHQALLIGALWPEGCGNVGYGAKVGSNHTGRKPDQEIRPGEGAFFGLGCSIKFPANFEESPYSLFAADVSVPPQRLAFPFSLIAPASSSPRGAEGLNEILPGWVWAENAFALIRGAYKFQDRNRAMRHVFPNPPVSEKSPLRGTFLSAGLFAPTLEAHVLKALAALKNAARRNKAFYLEREIPGLGRNFLSRKNLASGISAYENYLKFVQFRIVSLKSTLAPPKLSEATRLMHGLIASAETSLARDDMRGRKIFPDYTAFHGKLPENDAVCLRLKKDVESLLGPLRKRLSRS